MGPARPQPEIKDFHAHVYFDETSRDRAAALRESVQNEFPQVEMGRWWEKPVGPHPVWSYQIAFSPDLFADFVPWLMLNRQDCTIFLHPNTGDDLPDHRDRAVWMGEKLDLKLSVFD